jgi:predicted SAM-dependent methyltransferase
MSTLPYLNLGCGMHFDDQWVNVDFIKTGKGVIAHNLLKGVPFDADSFEVVYHSHVLEHFPKAEALSFIKECYRVLKPGGIIRIAVPDLEQIVNNYNRLLAAGKANPDNKAIRADYDWILTEMYDQAVRNESGGNMLKTLSADKLNNEEFIMQRIGNEGRLIRQEVLDEANTPAPKLLSAKGIISKVKKLTPARSFKDLLFLTLFNKEFKQLKLGKFRLSGEIHQWMYDVYSLSNLLKDVGFTNPEQKGFDTSSIANWRTYGLDEINNQVRKPDSLFIEAVK